MAAETVEGVHNTPDYVEQRFPNTGNSRNSDVLYLCRYGGKGKGVGKSRIGPSYMGSMVVKAAWWPFCLYVPNAAWAAILSHGL